MCVFVNKYLLLRAFFAIKRHTVVMPTLEHTHPSFENKFPKPTFSSLEKARELSLRFSVINQILPRYLDIFYKIYYNNLVKMLFLV